MPEIAALFVRRNSHYKALGLDCYDIERDATTWPGGSPAIYHPPCRAWGQYHHRAKPRAGEKELSLWAMSMVRKYGGVLEHPKNSKLWAVSGCLSPGIRDQFGGVLLTLNQCAFGHRALKPTCIYLVGAPVPEIPFSNEFSCEIEHMGVAEREATPSAFAEFLHNLALSCRK